MGAMKDIDIQLNELNEQIVELMDRVETHEIVLQRFFAIHKAVLQVMGDLAHDETVLADNRLKIFSAMFSELTIEDDEDDEVSDENVIPLFDE
mgnify:FL=1|jgi:hypothetical protein|tara:strand:+ start:30 stop:308 length:279 start_codon:yes stop_codon:yes gene_type:complete